MSPVLPPVPQVDPALLEAYEQAHGRLEAARTATDPRVDALFRRFAVETTCEAIAGAPPTFRGGAMPPLLPVPRSFLSAKEIARIAGVRAAVQYVDGRLAMVAQGHDTVAFRPESPYVLHALAEGRVDNPQVTNPGMLRATDVHQAEGLLIYPAPAEVRPLFEEAVRTATSAQAPACVRAAWLHLTTIFVHPFCDGNGRVAGLLYLLVAGEQLPAGVDWGVGEQLAARREWFAYSGPSRALDGSLDLTAVVARATRASSDGAALMRHRLVVLSQLHEHTAHEARANVDTMAVVALAVRRIATADVLAADIGVAYDETIERLVALVEIGMVRRVSLPPSRRQPGPARPAFALTDRAIATSAAVITRATTPGLL